MRIRHMLNEDYDAVYNLWMSCAGMGLNDIDDSQDGIERFLDRNPTTCFVAEEDGVVGVVLAGNDGRRGYIYHLAVASTHRTQGIGSQLVDAVLTALVELGITKVALVVFGRNELGNTFWDTQGFTLRDDLLYRDKALAPLIRIDT